MFNAYRAKSAQGDNWRFCLVAAQSPPSGLRPMTTRVLARCSSDIGRSVPAVSPVFGRVAGYAGANAPEITLTAYGE